MVTTFDLGESKPGTDIFIRSNESVVMTEEQAQDWENRHDATLSPIRPWAGWMWIATNPVAKIHTVSETASTKTRSVPAMPGPGHAIC